MSRLVTLMQWTLFIAMCTLMASQAEAGSRLAITNDHGCFIRIDGEVECWGANDTRQSTPPDDLEQPSYLAAGTYHTCAADDYGVTCWGLLPFSAPAANVTKIVVSTYDSSRGTYSVCYLHDGGRVGCSGWLSTRLPTDVDFVDIAMTPMGFVCALSQSRGVVCFGNAMSTENQVPAMTNVTSIHSTDETAFCAVADRRLKCWGTFDQSATDGLPEIQADDLLEVRRYGREIFCGYGRAVNRLWCASRDMTTPVVATLPRIRDVEELDMSGYAACAVSAGRVRCWGNGNVVGSVPPALRL